MKRRNFLGLAVGAIIARYLPRPEQSVVWPPEMLSVKKFPLSYKISQEMIDDDLYHQHVYPWPTSKNTIIPRVGSLI